MREELVTTNAPVEKCISGDARSGGNSHMEATPRIDLGIEVLQTDAAPTLAFASLRLTFGRRRRTLRTCAQRRRRCGQRRGYGLRLRGLNRRLEGTPTRAARVHMLLGGLE